MLYHKPKVEIEQKLAKNINDYLNKNQLFLSSLANKLNLKEEHITRHLGGLSQQHIHKFAQETAALLGKEKDFFYHDENIKVEKYEEKAPLGMNPLAFEFNFNEEAKEGFKNLEKFIDIIEVLENNLKQNHSK